MRSFITLLVLFPAWALNAQHYTDWFADSTLRIDYFRAGNASDDRLFLDKMLLEEGWDGSRHDLLDTFYFGEFRIEVRDEATGSPLYSWGYSTLFMEWQTTAEARSAARAYRESVRIPYPRDKVRIDFLRRDGREWKVQWELAVDPTDPDIIRGLQQPFPTVVIHSAGQPDTCLDIAILAEGYGAGEMDKFLGDARRFAEQLFMYEPFHRYRGHINIRAVLSASDESGTDLPHAGEWKRTAVNSRFFTFGSERYLTTNDYHAVMDLAANVPWDQVLILANSTKYGGGGIYNHYLLYTSDHALSGFVAVHEFGHSLAGLGDEYYTSSTSYEEFYDLREEPWEPNITTLVDFGSKWKDMVAEGTPIPTPDTEAYAQNVGVFEGAGYVPQGVYRPYHDCIMKSSSAKAFCPVCQRAIRRMLEHYGR